MKCNTCGKEIKEKALFCSNCGNIIGSMVENKKIETVKNHNIIIILVVLLLIFAIICYIIFKNTGQLVNMKGVKVYIPNDYEEKIKANYDKAYISKKEDIMIGVIIQKNTHLNFNDYLKALELTLKSTAKTNCEKEFDKNIKNTRWVKYQCANEKEKASMYTTIKEDTAYIVSLESITSTNTNNLENQVENHLELIK